MNKDIPKGRDLEGRIEDVEKKLPLPKIAQAISRLVYGLSSSELAKLIVLYEGKFREALEVVAREDPRLYRKFPQIGDEQTGLFAKIYFEKVLVPRKFKEALELNLPLSLAILDIDDFKSFNTRYGHEKGGDPVLDKFVEKLRELELENESVIANNFRIHDDRRELLTDVQKDLRSSYDRRKILTKDLVVALRDYKFDKSKAGSDSQSVDVGRVGGGEEFGILYFGTPVEGAAVSLQRVLSRIKNNFIPLGEEKVFITASAGLIGIPEFNQFARSPQELLSEAKKLVAVAKQEGKDRIRTPYRVYFAKN